VGGAAGEAQPTTLSKKRRTPWALVLGGLVAAGGAGAYFLMQPHQTVMQPHQSMMQPHQNPPPQQPVTAQLSVKTVPADAQLLLDEAPVANPFSGKFPRGDVRHHLTVKAAGYRSESQWIVFDADHELTVTLEKTIDTAKRPPETKAGKPIYKGTKGKLITTFPE
jgi:hypothetical protein